MPWGAVVSFDTAEQTCNDGGSSDVAPKEPVSSWARVAAVPLPSSSSSSSSNNTCLVLSTPSEPHAEQGDLDEWLDLESFQVTRRRRGRPSKAVAELLSKQGAIAGHL
eukprot:1878449-Amphidinium_carterae.5